MGLGIASASDRIDDVVQIQVRTIGLRNSHFEPGSSFKVEIEGVTQGAFASSEVTLSTRNGGKFPRTYSYTATDDLWVWRRGVAGHLLEVPLGSFRPEVGDEVLVTVSLFDEADALFGKGSTSVRPVHFDGYGTDA